MTFGMKSLISAGRKASSAIGVLLYASRRGAKPSPTRAITVSGVPAEAFVGYEISYAGRRRQEPGIAHAEGFAGGLANAAEGGAQPRGRGNRCNNLLRLMVNDLEPTRPEGNNLFDPGLCSIQIR